MKNQINESRRTAQSHTATMVSEGTILYKVYDGKFKSHSGFLFGRTLHRIATTDTGDTMQQGDTVVLEYGGNVCSYDWQSISRCPGGDHKPTTSVEDFCTFYETLIRRIRTVGGVPVLLSLTPICERLFFNHITNGRNHEHILRWLGGSTCFIRDLQQDYSNALLSLAERNAVPMIDIAPLVEQHHAPETLYEPDGIHLNDKGHLLIVDAIKKFYF